VENPARLIAGAELCAAQIFRNDALKRADRCWTAPPVGLDQSAYLFEIDQLFVASRNWHEA
jgi:hypothetical protein